MASRVASLTIPCLSASVMIVSLMAAAPETKGAENIRQYRAAITKIFLWRYQALPIFRLNPVFPGDVITLKNED
jgi:hypothetical protein